MKIFWVTAVASLGLLSAAAQLTEGKIIYERKMNVHRSLPPDAEQMKAMIPEFQTGKYELSFKGAQSLYKPYISEDEQMPTGDQGNGGGGGGGFRGGRFGAAPQGESFKDYEKNVKTDIRELGPKKYLLDDSLKHFSWRLSPDTMTIMGHPCHKATSVIKGGVMGGQQFRFGRRNGSDTANKAASLPKDAVATVWYADDIASSTGPDDYGGLPGLILLIDVDEGLLVFTPLNFESKAGTVKAPSNGKKISREDYKVLSEQQIGNMRRGGGGGQQVIIRN